MEPTNITNPQLIAEANQLMDSTPSQLPNAISDLLGQPTTVRAALDTLDKLKKITQCPNADCQKKFTICYDLRNHINLEYLKVNIFQCQNKECNKRDFSNEKDAKEHISKNEQHPVVNLRTLEFVKPKVQRCSRNHAPQTPTLSFRPIAPKPISPIQEEIKKTTTNGEGSPPKIKFKILHKRTRSEDSEGESSTTSTSVTPTTSKPATPTPKRPRVLEDDPDTINLDSPPHSPEHPMDEGDFINVEDDSRNEPEEISNNVSGNETLTLLSLQKSDSQELKSTTEQDSKNTEDVSSNASDDAHTLLSDAPYVGPKLPESAITAANFNFAAAAELLE